MSRKGMSWLWGLPSEDHTGLPCQVRRAASLRANIECCLDWKPRRAWQAPFFHVCLLWISAGQVQQWPSPKFFWVSAQPRYRAPGSSSVVAWAGHPGRPGEWQPPVPFFGEEFRTRPNLESCCNNSTGSLTGRLRTVIPTVRGSGLLFKDFYCHVVREMLVIRKMWN